MKPLPVLIAMMMLSTVFQACATSGSNLIPIQKGWSATSVNAVIFRHNSVVTHGETQYVAFYDPEGNVVLAKRRLGRADWEIRTTQYKGNVRDAHNTISIIVDGDGFLHVSWDHHGHPLRYCRSTAPGSLELTDKMPMTGKNENKVTYPEFYRMADGNLIFLYRDGGSGNGNLVMNRYDYKTKTWTQVHDVLIDGEGKRNAYWQMCTDEDGTIHLSWVWRESGDVSTNHDIGYARSNDGGQTWHKTTGEQYEMPLTFDNAEYAWRIPQNRALINTTSMAADSDGRPYIVNYWKPEGSDVPQYHLVYHDGETWQAQQITQRTTPFDLQGGGSKRIPISRPRIIADNRGKTDRAYMIYRDVERGDRVTAAICDDLRTKEWRMTDLTEFSVNKWEPSHDTELWKNSKQLHLYVQAVGQGDRETLEDVPPQMVYVLEWKPD